MPTSAPFMVLHKSCDQAVDWATRRLEQAGLLPVRTFDLQTARLAHLDYPCPHHGSAQCNCQMVVLLVYQADSPPATLVVHGSSDTSWFYLVNTPQQPIGRVLEKNIQEVINFKEGAAG